MGGALAPPFEHLVYIYIHISREAVGVSSWRGWRLQHPWAEAENEIEKEFEKEFRRPALEDASLNEASLNDASLRAFNARVHSSIYIYICILVWTRALNARSEASLSEASLSEASSSTGLRNYFSNSFFDLFFDYPLGAVEAFLDAKRLRSEHFRAFFDVKRLRSEHFRAFFDVWRLRSEHFRAFSTSGGSGARILEVSRGEQLRPRVQSYHGEKRRQAATAIFLDR